MVGARRLANKARRYRPRAVAVLGIDAYRTAFQDPKGCVGTRVDLGGAMLWVLPNPSGLNAHYRLEDLARLFAELRQWMEASEVS